MSCLIIMHYSIACDYSVLYGNFLSWQQWDNFVFVAVYYKKSGSGRHRLTHVFSFCTDFLSNESGMIICYFIMFDKL